MKVKLLRGVADWEWYFRTFTCLDIFLEFLSKSVEKAFLLHEGRQSLRSLVLSIKVNIPQTVFSSLLEGIP